jgi:hypothetical protein
MRFKSYKDIESLTPEFVESIVAQEGVPDNFVESGEGTLLDLPNPATDQNAKDLIDRLKKRLNDLQPDSLG